MWTPADLIQGGRVAGLTFLLAVMGGVFSKSLPVFFLLGLTPIWWRLCPHLLWCSDFFMA